MSLPRHNALMSALRSTNKSLTAPQALSWKEIMLDVDGCFEARPEKNEDKAAQWLGDTHKFRTPIRHPAFILFVNREMITRLVDGASAVFTDFDNSYVFQQGTANGDHLVALMNTNVLGASTATVRTAGYLSAV